MSQPIGLLIQFQIAELFFSEDCRDGIRALLDLLFKELMHTLLTGVVDLCVIPFHQQLLALSFGEKWQVTDLLVRVCDHSLQQGQKMADHPLHGSRFPQVSTINKHTAEFAWSLPQMHL